MNSERSTVTTPSTILLVFFLRYSRQIIKKYFYIFLLIMVLISCYLKTIIMVENVKKRARASKR
jgi:hypothetical protein